MRYEVVILRFLDNSTRYDNRSDIQVLDLCPMTNYTECHEYYSCKYPDSLILSRFMDDFKIDYPDYPNE